MSKTNHDSDRDCAGHIVDDECCVCRVHHGDPCDTCAGRGFHADGCPEIVGNDVDDQDAFDRACVAYRRDRAVMLAAAGQHNEARRLFEASGISYVPAHDFQS